MKNFYLKMLSFLFLGFIGVTAYAQGTWKATGTETAIAASTEITMGITSLKCMHSDAATVIGKTDAGATTVSYNGVTYDNEAFIQGATNGMYYAFLPSKSGTLDIAVKMGSGKKTFILELTDALWTSLATTAGNLALLTTTYGTADGLTGTPGYFTLPSVYDTYNNTNGTWDGSTAIQSTGGNVYLVMSFPVAADKTYVVGCFGSKMMLRGVSLATTTSIGDNVNTIQVPEIFPNPAFGKVFINLNETTEIGIYSLSGLLLKQQLASPSQNAIDISDLNPGLYFVKIMKNHNMVRKLIIR
jgi:hypothetical protein